MKRVFIILCLISGILYVSASEVRAEDYKTENNWGLFLGNHTFSTQNLYKDAGALGFKMDFESNPYFSYRILLDIMSATGDNKAGGQLESGDMVSVEWGAGLLFHTPRTETVQVYAGAAIGLYTVSESRTYRNTIGSETSSGAGIGIDFLGGINFYLSSKLSLGLEANIKKNADVNMNSSDSYYEGLYNEDLSGQSLLFTLSFGF